MKLSLTNDNHTVIQVSIKEYGKLKNLIDSYILLYGGDETSRNSKYVYFEIYADLLNDSVEKRK